MRYLAGLLGGAAALLCASTALADGIVVQTAQGQKTIATRTGANGQDNYIDLFAGYQPGSTTPSVSTVDTSDGGLWVHTVNGATHADALANSAAINAAAVQAHGDAGSQLTQLQSAVASLSQAVTALQAIVSQSQAAAAQAHADAGALATATGQAQLLTPAQTSAAALGAKGDTPCAGDAGTCSVIALLERADARLTATIATLGSPFQVGGAVGLNCAVVSADQAYTIGQVAGCTMTATGRIKVGLSSAAAEGAPAAGYADAFGGLAPDGSQHAARMDAAYNLKVTSPPAAADIVPVPTPASSTTGVALPVGASGTRLWLTSSAMSVTITVEASSLCGSAAPAWSGTVTGPAVLDEQLAGTSRVVCVFASAGVPGAQAY